MIKIGKKDAIYSYLSYGVSLISKVIIIPIILKMISTNEYALWSVFLAIEGFVTLLDMGVAKLVARYATYAFCGAKEIPIEGLPEANTTGSVNYDLYFDVYFVAREFYKKIALFAAILLLLGTGYIYYLSFAMINWSQLIFAWMVFAASVVLQIYYTYISSFLKGIGKIKEIQQVSLRSAILEITLKASLVICGFGLLGLGIANFLVTLYKRIKMLIIFNTDTKGNEDIKKKAYKRYHHGETKQASYAFKKNAKELGSVVIAQYIQGQGMTLVCSMMFTLSTTAQYSLTTQLFGVLQSLVQIPFQVLQPKLNEYRLLGENEKLKNAYSFINLNVWCIFVLGTIVISFFANPVLAIIKSNTMVLPWNMCILFGINQLVIINHQRCTNIIGLGNEQPYAKAYAISAIVTLIFSILVFLSDQGLFTLILGSLIIQLSYNAWKWPTYVNQLFDIQEKETIARGFKFLFSLLKRKEN